jgi:hypothetical protein
VQFTGGSGGYGLSPQTTGIRIMDAVLDGKYVYPNGYIVYMNELGHTVNPYTGQTVARADPWAHIGWSG